MFQREKQELRMKVRPHNIHTLRRFYQIFHCRLFANLKSKNRLQMLIFNWKFIKYSKFQMVLRLLDRDDHDGGQDGEGGDVGFHGGPLIAAWLPIINFAVLIAALRWHKYSFYIHVLLGLLVIGLTLGATIHVLIDKWLSLDDQDVVVRMHSVAGFIVVIWLGLQIFSGILARVIQYSPKVGTKACIWIKRFHYISSYLLMITAKFEYLNIKFVEGEFEGSFVILLIIDILFLIIYLLIKFKYWTLSEEIIDNQLVDKERPVEENKFMQYFQSAKQSARSLCYEIKEGVLKIPHRIKPIQSFNSETQIKHQKYVVFNDFVYLTESFTQLHPGGEYVISLMNKRQIDRFMYGNYAAELTPNVKPQDHTQDSMRLCGAPVGKILRVSPMKGFKDFTKCKIISSTLIHPNCGTYLINLRPQGVSLRFDGFQSQQQIGQYFSLTISNQNGRKRSTRLYTTIWSLRSQNVNFMSNSFPQSTNFKQILAKNSQHEMKEFMESNLNMVSQETIPLAIKKYDNGELTPRLLAENFNGEIVLSQPMGAGMKFDQIPSKGKVIIVCGGTGILPFCDFIDLLFKRVKFLESPSLSNSLAKNDPLVAKDFIKEREFVLYCAAENALELPALTLYQINSLCQSQKILNFSSTMRIKKNKQIVKNQFTNISLQQDYFNANIFRHSKEGNLAQIYICGSPQMNHSIGKMMVENEVKEDVYHFM